MGAAFGQWGEDDPGTAARRFPGGWLLGALLLLVLVLVAFDQRPPSPLGTDAPADVASAARAMEVLADLASAPHSVGQTNHGRVRDLVVTTLQDAGLEASVQNATTDGRPAVYNVIGRLDGTGGPDADTILIAAHYDSVVDAPGAADDGVGTVAILEAVRALAAGEPMRNNVLVVITDAEEQGLWGARAFVQQHPDAGEVDMVLNFESGGPRGALVLVEVDRATPDMLRTIDASVKGPVTSSLMNDLVAAFRDAGIASTDLVEFRELGQPAFNLVNSKDTGYRHSPGDSVDRISLATLQHQVDGAYGLLRNHGDVDLDEVGGDGRTVWLSVSSDLMLAWSYTTNSVLVVLVLVGFGVLVRVARRRGLSLGATARVAGTTVLSVVAGILTATAVVGLIQLVRSDHRPHFNGLRPRLTFPGAGAPMEELYWFGTMGLVVGVTVLLLARARRRHSIEAMLVGTSSVFVLLAVLSAWGLTGASYLFVLPLLFLLPAHVLWLTRADAAATWPAVGIVAVGAVPTVLVGGILLVFFETFKSPNAALMAPMAALFASQLVAAYEIVGSADRRLPLLGTGGLGAVLLLVGLVTIHADPITETSEYLGPEADPTVDTDVLDAGTDPFDLSLVTTESGRHCVEVEPVPELQEPFAWCPLPPDVALGIDVQQVRFEDHVLLFGSTDIAADTLVLSADGRDIDVAVQRVDGIADGFWAVSVDAGLGGLDGMTATADGVTVAERHGFVFPDSNTDLRDP